MSQASPEYLAATAKAFALAKKAGHEIYWMSWRNGHLDWRSRPKGKAEPEPVEFVPRLKRGGIPQERPARPIQEELFQ